MDRKRFFAIVLCFVILLTGCSNPETYDSGPLNSTPQESKGEETRDPLEELRQSFKEQYSFHLFCEYMHLAYNGFSQETKDIGGRDDTHYSSTLRKQWIHYDDYYAESVGDFYYHTEGDKYVCYSGYDDNKIYRDTVSDEHKQQMENDRGRLVGAEGILPNFLQNFEEAKKDSQIITYTYQLPVEDLRDSNAFLGIFINNIFTYYKEFPQTYDPELNIMINCTLEVDAKTGYPISFFCDFSELEPFVLTDGALSSIHATNVELLTFRIQYDYDIEETVPIPERFQAAIDENRKSK